MKRLYILIASAIVLVAGLVVSTKATHAYNIQSGTNVSVSKRHIDSTVYAAGRTVDIDSEVFGDVFCAGQNVNISGTVHGDVICAGQTVNVSGKVDGNVRLAGQDVNLKAKVTGNATIAGQTFTLISDGSVGGDLTLGSGDATLNGKVGRDIVTGSGTLTINSAVGRDIKAQSTTMKLGSNANVGGNINLTSKNNLNKESGAIVAGKVTRTVPQQQSKSKHWALFGFSLVWFIGLLVAMLAAAMVLTLLFPQLIHRTTDNAVPQPWMALGVGFTASILVPVLTLLLAATVIGLPLAFMLGLAWFVILLLSGPLFGYYLGRLILRGSTQPLLIMLVGATVLLVLYFIPIIGILAAIAAVWIGTGMLVLQLYHTLPKPSYNLKNTTARKKA